MPLDQASKDIIPNKMTIKIRGDGEQISCKMELQMSLIKDRSEHIYDENGIQIPLGLGGDELNTGEYNLQPSKIF